MTSRSSRDAETGKVSAPLSPSLLPPPRAVGLWEAVTAQASSSRYDKVWRFANCGDHQVSKGPQISAVLGRLRIMQEAEFLLRLQTTLLTGEVGGVFPVISLFSDCGLNVLTIKLC